MLKTKIFEKKFLTNGPKGCIIVREQGRSSNPSFPTGVCKTPVVKQIGRLTSGSTPLAGTTEC